MWAASFWLKERYPLTSSKRAFGNNYEESKNHFDESVDLKQLSKLKNQSSKKRKKENAPVLYDALFLTFTFFNKKKHTYRLRWAKIYHLNIEKFNIKMNI